MHFRCMFTLLNWLCAGRIGLGWAYDVFTIAYHMLMHFHAYVLYILYILIYWLYWCFSMCLSLSFFRLVALWHLNENLLHPETFFILGLLLPFLVLHPFTSSSMMGRPNQTSLRTFLDEAFIQNAKSFF